MGKLDHKIAIVTGAGRGIGRGIAEKLAAEGAVVVVTDVDEQSAVHTAKELGGGSDRHVGLRVDVTDRACVTAMVTAVTVDRIGFRRQADGLPGSWDLRRMSGFDTSPIHR